ncbi:hypothetical protein CEXT_796881 [Caerostris extrusa]|uniref:S-protein homolog n=1 Tax=Caerostris extrusa TaxID=172846 RepID=A0AAV4XCV9_CAEEX|nr:hypothetical protein CEXT_796881 [Caerostris extrusa]
MVTLLRPPLECESTDQGVAVSCRYRPHGHNCAIFALHKIGEIVIFSKVQKFWWSNFGLHYCWRDVYEDGPEICDVDGWALPEMDRWELMLSSERGGFYRVPKPGEEALCRQR